MRIVTVAAAISLAILGLSQAEDATASIRVPTDIPAQPLSTALQKLSSDRDIQLIFRTDLVGDRRTSGAVGELTLDEALTRLLAGSGLTWRYLDDRTVTVMPKAVGKPIADGTANLGGATQEPAPETFDKTHRFPSGVHLAQAGGGDGAGIASVVPDSKTRGAELEEVVVTGSHTRGANPTSSVHTITRTETEQSGYSQIGDVIRSLPENFSGGQNPGVFAAAGAQNINYSNASTVNLRGLGTDATLVLLNGHRLSGDSVYQGSDISGVPLAAVERVEVVPDGASAGLGGWPEGAAAGRWKRISALLNADRIRAPLLVNAADTEYVAGLGIFTSLQQLGSPVEEFVYPYELHIKNQPKHRYEIYERNLDWIDYWLNGRQASDESRREQYRRWAHLRALRTAGGPGRSAEAP